VLAGQKDTFEVVVDLCVPSGFGQFHRAAGGGTSDIVHENVDAPKMPTTYIDHSSDARPISHVADMRFNQAANLAGAIERLVHRGSTLVDCQNLGALPREQNRSRTAVPPAGADAAGTRNNCNPILQSACHDVT
jgi:hypothetical protein